MEAQFSKYTATHAELCRLARTQTIKFPSYDPQSKKYFVSNNPGQTVPWDANRPDTWDDNFGKTVSPELAQVFAHAQGKIASLQLSDQGLDEYFSCMANPSLILTLGNGTKIWQCSAEGVVKLGTNTPNAVRVSLESTPTISGDFTHVCLDDGAPMMETPSINYEQFCLFLSTLEKAFLAAQQPNQNIIVNCSQGQSRSGLFVICLLMKLSVSDGFHQSLAERIPQEFLIKTSDWNQLLCSTYKFVNFRRVITYVNPKFVPFLIFMAITIYASNLSVDRSASSEQQPKPSEQQPKPSESENRPIVRNQSQPSSAPQLLPSIPPNLEQTISALEQIKNSLGEEHPAVKHMLQICTAYFRCLPEIHAEIQRRVQRESGFLLEQLRLKENALAEREKALNEHLSSLPRPAAQNMSQPILSTKPANNTAFDLLFQTPR